MSGPMCYVAATGIVVGSVVGLFLLIGVWVCFVEDRLARVVPGPVRIGWKWTKRVVGALLVAAMLVLVVCGIAEQLCRG